jgi:type II secretory pathway pseudopilin PulG
MKILSHIHARPSRTGIRAFTLIEMMVTVVVFLFTFIGVMVAIQIFALRTYTLSATKLSATAGARKVLGSMGESIREGKTVKVGNYTNSIFSPIPSGQPQIGNAVMVSPLTNSVVTNDFIIYFQDSANTNISSVTNGVVTVLANYVTNYYAFQAEDFNANVLSNFNQNNPVIHVTMQFFQWEYPLGFIGSNAINAYDIYRLQTKIARRAKSIN